MEQWKRLLLKAYSETPHVLSVLSSFEFQAGVSLKIPGGYIQRIHQDGLFGLTKGRFKRGDM